MESSDNEKITDLEDDSIDLKFISDLLIKEIQSPILQSLPSNLYKRIAKKLEYLSSQNYDDIELDIRDKMILLICESTKLLLWSRYKKINLNEDDFFSPIPNTSDYSKLTDEEKYILDAKIDRAERKNAVLDATLDGNEKILDLISQIVRSKHIIVRFLDTVEEFVGMDMNAYGPFDPEDVAILPYENARSLVESKRAREIYNLQYRTKET
jgi:DNA replication factor GINS